MFRFTIRDVLWLTLVVSLLAALWIEHRAATVARRLASETREEAIALASATVYGPGEGMSWHYIYSLQLKYGAREPLVHTRVVESPDALETNPSPGSERVLPQH